jgi:hypothetical protein
MSTLNRHKIKVKLLGKLENSLVGPLLAVPGSGLGTACIWSG